MSPASQHPQHAAGVFRISRFSQNRPIHDNNRISPKHEILWVSPPYLQRFLASQPLGAIASVLAR